LREWLQILDFKDLRFLLQKTEKASLRGKIWGSIVEYPIGFGVILRGKGLIAANSLGFCVSHNKGTKDQ
jgi:hypothetical protein